jgi:hypothetical protein
MRRGNHGACRSSDGPLVSPVENDVVPIPGGPPDAIPFCNDYRVVWLRTLMGLARSGLLLVLLHGLRA